MAETQGFDRRRLDRRDIRVDLVGIKRLANDGADCAATLGLTHELGDGLRDIVQIRGILALEPRHEGLEHDVGDLTDLAVGLRHFGAGGALNAFYADFPVNALLHRHPLYALSRHSYSDTF